MEGYILRNYVNEINLNFIIPISIFKCAIRRGTGGRHERKRGTQCFGGGTNVGVTFDRIGKFSKFRMLEGEPPPSPSPEMSL